MARNRPRPATTSATAPRATEAAAHPQYMPVANRIAPTTAPRMTSGPCLGTLAMSSR